MNANPKPNVFSSCTVFTVTMLCLVLSPCVSAEQVYHWVDANGVSHFSQWAPQNAVPDLSVLTLDTTQPSVSEEDIYGVEQQKEQMDALWSDLEARRQASQERKLNSTPQTIISYQQDAYSGPALWPYNSPQRPNRPARPQRPIEEPPGSYPFKPPARDR